MQDDKDTIQASAGGLSVAQIHQLLSEGVNERIEILEQALLQEEQVELPVEHLFVNGMYARKITIPKGTMLTGAVHKWGYVDIMLSGDISVATPDGIKRLTGWQILEGKPGRKRAGFAHEDTHWITVHRTDATTPDGIEDILTTKTMREFNALPIGSRALLLTDNSEA